MGMFDWYLPKPVLTCPVCGIELMEWQGKDGPCGLFVWAQGVAYPVDQPVELECRLDENERQHVRLPNTFSIYTYDCNRHKVTATCSVTDGIWIATQIAEVKDA